MCTLIIPRDFIMGIGIEQYRVRVGLFNVSQNHNRARTLSLFDVFCIYCLVFYQSDSLPVIVLLCFFDFEKCVASEISHIIHQSNVDYILMIVTLLSIMEILLLISGLEFNPGPMNINHALSNIDPTDTRSSDCPPEFSHIYEIFSNSISFLHLNVQSLLPKLDLIIAEYNDFDIWLLLKHG